MCLFFYSNNHLSSHLDESFVYKSLIVTIYVSDIPAVSGMGGRFVFDVQIFKDLSTDKSLPLNGDSMRISQRKFD